MFEHYKTMFWFIAECYFQAILLSVHPCFLWEGGEVGMYHWDFTSISMENLIYIHLRKSKMVVKLFAILCYNIFILKVILKLLNTV
jgi:hypothetical protein